MTTVVLIKYITHMRSAWDILAEKFGIKTEINWDAINKKRQMQQYGTVDRRSRAPSTLLKTPQQIQRAQQQRPRGIVNPNAMAQIPAGTDVPGQLNPLFGKPVGAQTQLKSKSPLSTPPNSPQAFGKQDDEDENTQY